LAFFFEFRDGFDGQRDVEKIGKIHFFDAFSKEIECFGTSARFRVVENLAVNYLKGFGPNGTSADHVKETFFGARVAFFDFSAAKKVQFTDFYQFFFEFLKKGD
jgi:hypothetical protein